MRRRARLLALLAVFAMIVAACNSGTADETTTTNATATTESGGDGGATTTEGAASSEPIRIGASLPLTGEFSVPGSKHADGYQFCVDEINARGGILGRDVELTIEDNRSDTEVAVTQVQRFIDVENVDLLFGTFSSLLTFPASAAAEQAGMVYPIPSGGALRIWSRGFQNIFYFQQTSAEEIGAAPMAMIDYYTQQGIIDPAVSTAAIVWADDFFADAIAKGLLGGEVTLPGSDEVVAVLDPGFLAEAGIEAAYQETWPEGFTDWLTLANSIKNSGADIVMAATASPDEAISLVNALQTVAYQPKLVYMSQGTQSEFHDSLGDAADGITIHSSWHPLANFSGTLAGEEYTNQDFIDGFTAAMGRAPDEDEAIPFAVCQGMEQAVIGTGTTDNAQLSEWLHARTTDDPVQTIMGPYAWDERGLPIDRVPIMTQWQNDTLEFVYPIGEFPGTVDLVYPKPEW